MTFRSILFDGKAVETLEATEPDYFADLQLDRIIDFMTAGFEEYDLKPFFYTPLNEIGSIDYRYDIMRDLEGLGLRAHVEFFSKGMRSMREQRAQADKIDFPYQKQRVFLDAVDAYCDAVDALERVLTSAELRADGLLLLRDYLSAYTHGQGFQLLAADAKKLKVDLAHLRYCVEIAGLRITVSRYDSEADYGAAVAGAFAKFKHRAGADYAFSFPAGLRMSQVEEIILDRVARLFPSTFSSLRQFFDHYQDYLDETISRFDREVQFYMACIHQMSTFKWAGLALCYPAFDDEFKGILGREVFDLALAKKLTTNKAPVVRNDIDVKGAERVVVVSGANQGGKTTFARAVGQLLYLASIGCPVPAREARVFLFDRLFTHFEREEDVRNLSGKLENDLERIRAILDTATARSVLIMNESFSSTTLADALFLSREVLGRIRQRRMFCVSVTFFDELAALGPQVVSMVATVDASDQAARTYKVIRKKANGLAYAATIARKYRLTYPDLKARLAP